MLPLAGGGIPSSQLSTLRTLSRVPEMEKKSVKARAAPSDFFDVIPAVIILDRHARA